MFPYFRSASQFVPSWFASAKRPPAQTQKRRNRLSVLQLEDRVTPSAVAFNLSSSTVAVGSSSAIILGTLTDTFAPEGSLTNSSISINWGDGHADHNATVTANLGDLTKYSISESHNYAKAGSYTVTVTDSDTHTVASAATTINVTPVVPASGIAFNLPTSIVSVPASTSANGTSVSLGTFTDTNVAAGDLSNTTISIDWGDETTTSGTAVDTVPPSQTYSIFGGTGVGSNQVHNYAPGTYTVTVTVNEGGVPTDSATATVKAVAPDAGNGITLSLSSPSVESNNSAAIGLGTVTDTNVAGGLLAGSQVTIKWGDGQPDTNATLSPLAANSKTYAISGSHTYAGTGSHTVTVTVDDGTSNLPKTTTINVITFATKTVNFTLSSPEVPVNSTSTTDTLGTFSDTNGVPTATVDWGDGTQGAITLTTLANSPDAYTVPLNHPYQTFGTFTATVTATDSTGTYSATTPVTVYSTQLAIVLNSVKGSPQQTAGLAAILHDPGSTLASGQYHVSIDWGDGSPADTSATILALAPLSPGDYAIGASHTYGSSGTYVVKVTATRAGGLPFSSISQLTTAVIRPEIKADEWMKKLSNSLPLTDISIPGTHQSAAGGTLLDTLAGDQDLLEAAEKAQKDATDGDIAAFAADSAALLGGELVPPLVVVAAAADTAAATVDGLAATAWGNYAASLGSDAYPGLKDAANSLHDFNVGLAALDAASAALHIIAAGADIAAESEAELNPVADGVQAVADTASAAKDALKVADYAFYAAGDLTLIAASNGEKTFDGLKEKALEKAAELQTQDLGITDQLKSGIRALDIRGALVNDTIRINNGDQYTGVTLQEVLNDATAFLHDHSSETIVMSLRSNEAEPSNSPNGFSADLTALVNSNDGAVPKNADGTTPKYGDFIYTSSSPTSTPDLGQVRGKIVIIPYAPDSASAQTGSSFGWLPTVKDQTTTSESDPDTLWNDAEGENHDAGLIPTDLGNPNTLYINNLASEGPLTSTPIEISDEVNPIARECFGSFHVARTTGIVGIDNPDPELINDIIAENNQPIMVTSDADAGAGSLRAAIDQANSQPGVNTIEFASTMTGPSGQLIILQSDLPVINNDVDIVGSVFVEGNHHLVFQNPTQHTVTEVNFVADAGVITPTPVSPSPSVPLYVTISGLTIFDHLAFTTAPQTLIAGVVSSPITLQLQDAKNLPVVVAAGASPLVLNLTTTSTPTPFAHAEFRDSTGITPITSESLTAGNSSTPLFTYYDEVRGKPTLTATVGTVPLVTQTEKVNASVPVSITFVRQPATVYANTSIAPSVQLMDRFHNFVAFIPVTLTLNPVSVPAMRTGSRPVLRGTHIVKTPDDLNALANFSTASVNLPGIYTVKATITVNGKKLSVISKQFTIKANPNTVTTKVR